jgi:hypothetical protein
MTTSPDPFMVMFLPLTKMSPFFLRVMLVEPQGDRDLIARGHREILGDVQAVALLDLVRLVHSNREEFVFAD